MLLTDLTKTTRQFFWQKNFDEVETPYLNSSLPLEQNIYSFTTTHSHSQAKYYLPTSPELALKKHLAATSRPCFSITHCFRDLENSSPTHTPEFLMLEWYLINADLLTLMESVQKYLSLFIKNLKFQIINLPDNLPDNEPDFNQYFLNQIEPNLPVGAAFIVGYPAFLSPLAEIFDEGNVFFDDIEPALQTHRKQKKSLPSQKIAKRFELYINGIEIANGCVENRDPVAIRRSFETEQKFRQKNNLPLHPFSAEFIDYCAQIPPSAGVGLGLNRLLTLIP